MRSYTFICGCGHSGTSLLANMLASHPDIYIPLVETRAFVRPDRAAQLWAEVLSQAETSGKAHLAEKTPRHVQRLDLIRAMVPQARFVLVVRDGRDVAASYIKRRGSADVGRLRWLEENRRVLAARGDADATVLRYEDLIAGPEAALRGVCDFAGIPFDPEMLRYHETERLWFGTIALEEGDGSEGEGHRNLRNWQINQPIFDGRGRWRTLLSPEETAAFEDPETHRMLEAFGYA
jgi:hypothetical protein